MAAAELARQGWHLAEEGISELGSRGSADSIIKKALDTDLREIGGAWLSDDINRGRLDYVVGPNVLQVSKLRVVSAPKDNEDSHAAPKIYRLSLTDGHVTCSAVTLEPIKGLGLTTPPGSKLLLSGTVEVETNFLLLTSKNTTFLGGRVSNLADSWELKKSLAKQSLARSNQRGEGGPPPFVPFGNKILSEQLPPPKKDNFRSLAGSKEKKTSEGEDTEFQQQRQAALNEALQAKGSSRGGKTFGGGKFLVNDRDVARITEMGFSASEATSALKVSAGNVGEAINSLLSGGQRFQRGGDRGRSANHSGGVDGRGEGRRRGRDRDMDYDGEESVNSRPSGPATLFDFLETKIPTKHEPKKSYKSSDIKTQFLPSSTSLSNDSLKFVKDNTNDRPQSRPPPKTFEPSSSGAPPARSNYTTDGPGGYQDSYRRGKGENNFNNRGQQLPQQQQQQNVPPRFAKLGRGDGQRTGGQGRNDGGGVYRGRGERYNGNKEEGYNNRFDTYPDKSKSSFKENNYNEGGKGAQSYSGSYRDDKSQSYSGSYKDDKSQSYSGSYRDDKSQSYSGPYREDKPQSYSGSYQEDKPHSHRGLDQQDEMAHGPKDELSSDNKKQPSNQVVDAGRNVSGDQGTRRDGAGSRQQNYGSGQYRNSSRSDGQDGTSQPYKNQPSNRSYNQQTPLMATPYSQQPPQEPQLTPVNAKQGYVDRQPFTVESSIPVSIGDNCLARYWEDSEFYQAIVEALAPDGSTAIVTFINYGNQEEVCIEDLQPLQQQRWAYQVSAPIYGVPNMNTSFQDPSSFQGTPSYVPPMEFTRGGSYYSNNGGRRQDYNDRRKPTQTRYLPPNQRPH